MRRLLSYVAYALAIALSALAHAENKAGSPVPMSALLGAKFRFEDRGGYQEPKLFPYSQGYMDHVAFEQEKDGTLNMTIYGYKDIVQGERLLSKGKIVTLKKINARLKDGRLVLTTTNDILNESQVSLDAKLSLEGGKPSLEGTAIYQTLEYVQPESVATLSNRSETKRVVTTEERIKLIPVEIKQEAPAPTSPSQPTASLSQQVEA